MTRKLLLNFQTFLRKLWNEAKEETKDGSSFISKKTPRNHSETFNLLNHRLVRKFCKLSRSGHAISYLKVKDVWFGVPGLHANANVPLNIEICMIKFKNFITQLPFS